jgi:hypothetical protein
VTVADLRETARRWTDVGQLVTNGYECGRVCGYVAFLGEVDVLVRLIQAPRVHSSFRTWNSGLSISDRRWSAWTVRPLGLTPNEEQ